MASNSDALPEDLSRKLNVLITLSVRQLLGEKDFTLGKRKWGVTELGHFLAEMAWARTACGIVGSPVTNVRTLLTPTGRK